MNETEYYPDDLNALEEPLEEAPVAESNPLPDYATKEDLARLSQDIVTGMANLVQQRQQANAPIEPDAYADDAYMQEVERRANAIAERKFKEYEQALESKFAPMMQTVAPVAHRSLATDLVGDLGDDYIAAASTYLGKLGLDPTGIAAVRQNPVLQEMIRDAAVGSVANRQGRARPEPADAQGLTPNSRLESEWREFAGAFGHMLPKDQKQLTAYKQRWIKERA